MFSSNPFMGNNPFTMANPFTNSQRPTSPGGDFNVDELVKKIDAKIAELEEEERREKEQSEKTIDISAITKEPTVSPKPAEVKPTTPKDEKINISELNKESKESLVESANDENFFDDFFADE